MLLNEMFSPPLTGYQDEEDDQNVVTWKNSIKTRITLRQLNKLRRVRDVHDYERAMEDEQVHEQYGAAEDDSGGF
jgi:hypothetical protein